MHKNNIGDATLPEELILQERLLRILTTSPQNSDMAFLYFNEDFSEYPPSASLFSDDDEDPNIKEIEPDHNRSKATHNMLLKLVTSKIIDQKRENIHNFAHIQDIVTRVHLPSEEFAQVVMLSPLKRFFSRLWSWCRKSKKY
ncbi:uncharacterized protein LOC126740332 [Anthonomus grandis grandis]|uniref:uncharacterized protein LOC126740332 n=1 Tax=Anthonomus grandis grandis TaxID=2921223 RepID=UPI0021658ABC|nr:uncharacterized protein LOC126740332 [Anthonomus grandis grandis]